MVQFIIGNKGKGKTKHLLDKVNSDIKNISGNIVYLDKSTRHMYDLNNKVRLIDVSKFMIESSKEFIGFVSGIISQDHDLEQMYFDSFLTLASADISEMEPIVAKLEKISSASGVDFILSVSADQHELPESLKEKVLIAL